MQNLQEDKYTMYLKVIGTCDKYESVWLNNKAFKTTYYLFKPKVSAISTNKDIQVKNITGITGDKQSKRIIMSNKALFIANRIESYARVIDNEELLKLVHYSSSDMRNARDTDIVSICDSILARANEYKSSLVDYDLTDATITDLQTAITTYNSIVIKPQITKAELKNATQNIALNIKQADEILSTRLDLDIEVFKTSNPDFYSEYKTSRIIISLGQQTTALSVIVKDNEGNPIPKVLAIITKLNPNPNNKEVINEISKKTTTKGTFKIINLNQANYKITLTKLGYTPLTVNFIINNGETTKLTLQLLSN